MTDLPEDAERAVTSTPTGTLEPTGEPSAAKAMEGSPHAERADHVVRVAKIRVTAKEGAPARGFTFGRGKVVEAVPFAHAEFLVAEKKAVILEVSEVPAPPAVPAV